MQGRSQPFQTKQLETKFHSQLNLPRIIDGARRSIQRVRRPFAVGGRSGGTAKGRWVGRAKIRCAVNSIEEADVQGVRKVEGFGNQLEALLFAESKCSCKAEVDSPEVVSDKRIAGIDPDTVVISKDVAVGVKSREFGEALWRLDGGDQAD